MKSAKHFNQCKAKHFLFCPTLDTCPCCLSSSGDLWLGSLRSSKGKLCGLCYSLYSHYGNGEYAVLPSQLCQGLPATQVSHRESRAQILLFWCRRPRQQLISKPDVLTDSSGQSCTEEEQELVALWLGCDPMCSTRVERAGGWDADLGPDGVNISMGQVPKYHWSGCLAVIADVFSCFWQHCWHLWQSCLSFSICHFPSSGDYNYSVSLMWNVWKIVSSAAKVIWRPCFTSGW